MSGSTVELIAFERAVDRLCCTAHATLTLRQLRILAFLRHRRGRPCSNRAIGSALSIPAPAIVRALDNLVTRGLATRIVMQNDHRLRDVEITDAGAFLLEMATAEGGSK